MATTQLIRGPRKPAQTQTRSNRKRSASGKSKSNPSPRSSKWRNNLRLAQAVWLYLFDPTITASWIHDHVGIADRTVRRYASIAKNQDPAQLSTGVVWKWDKSKFEIPPWPTNTAQASIEKTDFVKLFEHGGVMPMMYRVATVAYGGTKYRAWSEEQLKQWGSKTVSPKTVPTFTMIESLRKPSGSKSSSQKVAYLKPAVMERQSALQTRPAAIETQPQQTNPCGPDLVGIDPHDWSIPRMPSLASLNLPVVNTMNGIQMEGSVQDLFESLAETDLSMITDILGF